MLRVSSFVLLLIPLINTYLQAHGVTVAPESVESFINATFVVAFGVFHIWGWMRAVWFKA